MRVSVIIPNYNHAAFLKQRIDSVFNQTFQDFEVIILDDCSTDNSKEIIENYRNQEKIECIIFNESNSGSTFKQWKKGIELAKGDYIWIAESDDIAENTFLEKLIPHLIDDKNLVLAYCQSNKVNDKTEILGSWVDWTKEMNGSDIFNAQFKLNGEDFIKRFLIYKNVIPNASAVLFRKDILLKVGGVNTNIKYCADWLVWMKILTMGDVFFNNECNNSFRQHDKSLIATAASNLTFIKKYDLKMRKAFDVYLKNIKNQELRRQNKELYKKELEIEMKLWEQNKQYHKVFKHRVNSMFHKW
jgi:glycosyltransferase involved in cell wall biosynthesis